MRAVAREPGRRAGRPAAIGGLVAALALGACAQGQGYDTGTTSLGGVGLGTGGGAGAGALLGRAIAGKRDNTLAMLGGALLGGVAGNVLVDRPNQIRGEQQAQTAANADEQRKLDYERQSQLQQARVQGQIEDQKLYEQWKAQRTAAGTAPAAAAGAPGGGVTTADDLRGAQRLLYALGYYRGPIDGVYGAQTRSAVMQFETSQGLPPTGVVTPAIVQRMKAAL